METIIVGERGQITIPSKYRKKFNIKPKQPLLITEMDGKLVIIPAKIVPADSVKLREFTDKEIEMFLKMDKISNEEAQKIKEKIDKL